MFKEFSVKSLVCFLVLFGSNLVYAGSSNCTGPSVSVTASGNYNALSSDCMISVDKTFFEFTYVYLPASPSVGDQYTILENTTAHECDEYEGETYCWPAGVGIQSLNQSHTVDGVETDTLFGIHSFVKLTFDGSDWNAEYGSF